MNRLEAAGLVQIGRGATISPCGAYRVYLLRVWDKTRPALAVCMFNPSTADARVDDPTITLLMLLALHNGYGSIHVVNGIPLRTSTPGPALDMLRWDESQDWHARDRLQQNLAAVGKVVAESRDVLLAWGALADRAADGWFEHVLEQIECALPEGGRLLCLGKTKSGQPMHPLARGKHRVRPDATFLPWRDTA